jgi:hypothetical protein
MIIEIPQNNKILPHKENILKIHNSHPVLNLLNDYNPIIAGGYPMALLFAPRKKENTDQIVPGYYSDYDIYFETKDAFESAQAHIEANYDPFDFRKYETTNASSYTLYNEPDPILGPDKSTQIQLIRKLTAPPQDALKTFDFINCAVGYAPKTGSFFVHEKAFAYHYNKELEILNPWMLEGLDDTDAELLGKDNIASLSNIIIQIARFKKYCIRWEYTLGTKAFQKLLSIYEKHPHLKMEKDMTLRVTGGLYDQAEYVALQNQNVWEAIAPIIRSHELWRDYKDEHGHLNGKNELHNQEILVDLM